MVRWRKVLYFENMLMWLRDFHIDGLRLDAVHAIKDFSPTFHLCSSVKKPTNLKKLPGGNIYSLEKLILMIHVL